MYEAARPLIPGDGLWLLGIIHLLLFSADKPGVSVVGAGVSLVKTGFFDPSFSDPSWSM